MKKRLADYTKGDMVKAKVLDVDVEKERISLGIKQMACRSCRWCTGWPQEGRCRDLYVHANHGQRRIEVMVNDSIPGFIRKGDLSRDRSEQRPDRFAAGEKVDAKSHAGG